MRMGMSYLRYRSRASTRHGLHSPFVYNLNEKVIQQKGALRQWEIESFRYELLNDITEVELKDLGAGSRISSHPKRKVKEITRYASSSKSIGALLQRLADFIEATRILELGANLGLTSAYLGASKSAKKVLSIEGDPFLSTQAAKLVNKLQLPVEILCGSFEEKLPTALENLGTVDLAYIDGNHRLEPTAHYFNQILPYTTNQSVVVVGDIHWSQDMEKAWEIIKNHPSVSVTIDLFYLGLVFFRKEQAKEHFTIKHV